MEELLISTLQTFGYPVALQGSLGEMPYPDIFFTYWNNSSTGQAHYDNKETEIVWDFDVNIYGKSPALVFTTLTQAISALRAAGFIISGQGYTVASDEKTHVGRGVNALCLEKIGGNNNANDTCRNSGI